MIFCAIGSAPRLAVLCSWIWRLPQADTNLKDADGLNAASRAQEIVPTNTDSRSDDVIAAPKAMSHISPDSVQGIAEGGGNEGGGEAA